MSNESLRQANNVKAGIFVIVALIVGLVVVFLLGNLWDKFFGPPLTPYRTTFTVMNGVGYLQTGSEVRIGGIKVGRVEAVTFDETKDGALERIDVTFAIPTSIPLYSNAVATIKSGLISADSFVAITSVGFDENNRGPEEKGPAGTRLSENERFAGTGAPGMLGALLGPKGAAKTEEIITNIRDLTAKLNDEDGMMVALFGEEATEDVDTFLANLDEISTRMKTDGYVLKWVFGAPTAEEVQNAIKNVDTVIADIQSNWSATWSNEVDRILASVDSLSANADQIVADNKESINQIVADIKSVTNEARETWSPELTAVFSKASSTLDDVQVVVADVRAQAPLMIDNVGDALANVNVASQQLNRAIAEVSASPWRLLYRPTDKEYTNELLYEAARNFSFGAADLKSAAGSMQRLLDARGSTLNGDDQDFMMIRDNLVESFRRYERAQQQLMEILRGEDPVDATAEASDSGS
ncbi:MAG: MlaD family protein [Phycisphaerales bacterium]|nr:MlaD family protein [Phycisphaerales bacterium]